MSDDLGEISARRSLARLPLYPVLFAVWPPLALYAENVERIPFSVVTVPLLCFAAVGLVLPILIRPFVGTWSKAGVMAAVVVVAFCVVWKPVGQDWLLFVSALEPWLFNGFYTFFVFLALAILHQLRADFGHLTVAFNTVAVVLLAWPLFQIAGEIAKANLSTALIEPISLPANMANADAKPDVVLLILDEYSRADFLKEHLNFDNGVFVKALEARGFIVALDSRSNYKFTRQSIPSTLNMDYLSSITTERGTEFDPAALIEDNRVLRLFDAMDYETYAFTTGYAITEPGPLVDHIMTDGALVSMNEYAGMLLSFTPVGEVAGLLDITSPRDLWRDGILHTLRNLHVPIAGAGDRPVYVRAHVLSPHAPYVFSDDGGQRLSTGAVSLDEYDEGWQTPMIDQIRGINHHVLEAVDSVLAASAEPPIIIITSDHATLGKPPHGRGVDILLALYLPGKGEHVPRENIDSIHLVNLFRFIFNTYYDAGFEILDYQKFEGDED